MAEAMSGWMRKHWLWITSPKGRGVGREIPPDLPACVALSKCRESKAPAKRSQHANATCRNTVGRDMLRAFGHRVAMCWVLLAQI